MLLHSLGAREGQENGASKLLRDLHPAGTRSSQELHCVIPQAHTSLLWGTDTAPANILVRAALWCNLLHSRGRKTLATFTGIVSKRDGFSTGQEGHQAPREGGKAPTLPLQGTHCPQVTFHGSPGLFPKQHSHPNRPAADDLETGVNKSCLEISPLSGQWCIQLLPASAHGSRHSPQCPGPGGQQGHSPCCWVATPAQKETSLPGMCPKAQTRSSLCLSCSDWQLCQCY